MLAAAGGRARACCSSAPSRASACPTASMASCRWCRASGRISWRCSVQAIASAPRPKAMATTARWCSAAAIAARTSCDRRGARTRRAGRPDAWSLAARRTASPAWRKRLGRLVPLDGHAPKYHGLAFWFHAAADRLAVAEELRRLNAPALVDGRFETAPGMFSHDRIDPGSRLLAETLPADLSGKVADFCAGWGYLSAELIDALPRRDVGRPLRSRLSSRWKPPGATLPARAVETAFFWHDLIARTGRDQIRRDRHEPAVPSGPGGRAGDRPG